MKFKKLIIRILIILLLLVSLLCAFFYRASAQVRKTQKEVTKLAQKYAHLETVNNFYLYNGSSTYYTVTGTNDKAQKVLVTVPKKDGKIIIQNQNNGITENDARKKVQEEFHPEKITKVEFGYYKNQPIWEVTIENSDEQISYYLLSFKDGNVVHKVENF